MRVYLGCDHAGFELKNVLAQHLADAGHEVHDMGAHTYDKDDDYPSFCIAAAEGVRDDPEALAVVIGGSGNGEQIAANKVQGVRAALAYNVETATLARMHNNAQVVGVGARMHSEAEALEIVDAFLSTPFSGDERHQRRIDQLAAYDAR